MDDILIFDSTEYLYDQKEDSFTGTDSATEIQAEERSLDEAAVSDPVVDSVSDNSISNNEIVELLTEINDNLKEIKDVKRDMVTLQGNDCPDSVSVKHVSDNQAEYLTLSENNILTKPINDYTVSESFLFVISIVLIFGGIVLIIKKGLPRWR